MKRSSGSVLLVGLIVLCTAGIIGFLPLLNCPLDRFLEYTDVWCPLCAGRTRITLVQRWKCGSTPDAAKWEGMKLDWIEGKGFKKTKFRQALDYAGIFGGLPFTNQQRVNAAKALLATGCYTKVVVRAEASSSSPGTVRLDFIVLERPGELRLPDEGN